MTNDLPSGWTWATLGEVGRYLNGRAFKATDWKEHGRPIIRIQNLTGTNRHHNHYPGEVEDRHLVREGDLLLSWAATLGVFVWRGEEAVLNQHIFKVESWISKSFHRWLLQSVLDDLYRQAHGSGMVHITKRKFDRTPVPIPPLAEQERIVAAIEEHLSRLDALDTALKVAEMKLDVLRRSTAAALLDRSDWTWTTLGEIAALKGGITKDSKREADPDFVEYPYLRVANVQRGFFDLAEVTTIRADRHKATKLVLVPGDILFNEGGDRDKLGRGWVWEGQIENCIHQNHVFRARLTNSDFDPYFISMHANTWGQRWFETHGKQTTNLASLSLTTLKSFPVPAPSLKDQQAVVAELQSLASGEDRLREDLERAKRHSRTLQRSILSEAFAGDLVPQDPADEPASVLLEHIQAIRTAKPKRRRATA